MEQNTAKLDLKLILEAARRTPPRVALRDSAIAAAVLVPPLAVLAVAIASWLFVWSGWSFVAAWGAALVLGLLYLYAYYRGMAYWPRHRLKFHLLLRTLRVCAWLFLGSFTIVLASVLLVFAYIASFVPSLEFGWTACPRWPDC